MRVDIDENSGFCFGVVNAIQKAESELCKGPLYCVGDIVHNDYEVARLAKLGLKTISSSEMKNLSSCRVLFRAHGEPPSSYMLAKERGLEVIDASCPVVLNLQREIKRAYESVSGVGGNVVIYGKPGHAEVIGLVGQTNGKAIVIDSINDLDSLDYTHYIKFFSQTTKSLDGFREISSEMKRRGGDMVEVFDTICRKVANRIPQVHEFAAKHDVVFFVSGEKSSNGRQLFDVCKRANSRSYFVQGPDDIEESYFENADCIGISGANSTPRSIMNDIKQKIEHLIKR